MKIWWRASIIMAVLVLAVGCGGGYLQDQPAQSDSPKAKAYKALAVSKEIYASARDGVKAAEAMGKIKPADKAKADDLFQRWRKLHNEAVDTLLAGKIPDMTLLEAAIGEGKALILQYAVRKGG